MTNKEFKIYYDNLTYSDKWNKLREILLYVSIDCKSGNGYIVNNADDLDAVIKQEFYEELTERE
jgi:hypothetical protein